MKTFSIVFFVCLILVACENSSKEERAFDEFDFSFGNTFETEFSIKFTYGDTVFVREHWTSEFDTKLKPNTNYVSTLKHKDRLTLDSMIKNINFSKFDTFNYDDYSDGYHYKYYIKNQHVNKKIYVHCWDNGPAELDTLAYRIYHLKKNLKLQVIDTTLTFGSVENFLPQPPPPPPPRVK
jgi:hypothetical protein